MVSLNSAFFFKATVKYRLLRAAPIVAFVAVAGCHPVYTPPLPIGPVKTTETIPKPKPEVWQALVNGLAGTFFVINNLDRESGYISISYSGNPEDFVDCGSVQFHNATTDYNYNVASQTSPPSTARQVELSGRINVLVSPATGSETKVSVIVRYIVTEKFEPLSLDGMFGTNQVYQTTAAFNSGNYGAMGRYVCRPTGKLEQQILSLSYGK